MSTFTHCMELLRKLARVPESAARAVALLLKAIGRAGKHAYPFGNPVSVERCHVSAIKQMPYWVAEKTDGVRVALVCTTLPGTTQGVSYLMDRVGRLYGLPIAGSRDLFRGSIFDAELVHEQDTDVYTVQVFDVAALRGDAGIAARPYSERRAALFSVFPKVPVDTDRVTAVLGGHILCGRHDVHLLAKQMYPLHGDGSDVKGAVTALRHASDGYILTPEREGAPVPGTAWTTYKIKASHTIDLLWSGNTLWYGEGETLFPITDLRVEGLVAAPTHVSEQYKDAAGCVVEVTPTVLDDDSAPGGKRMHLTFLKVRLDRDAPNNVVCVLRTLKSALDAVTIDDLYDSTPV